MSAILKKAMANANRKPTVKSESRGISRTQRANIERIQRDIVATQRRNNQRANIARLSAGVVETDTRARQRANIQHFQKSIVTPTVVQRQVVVGGGIGSGIGSAIGRAVGTGTGAGQGTAISTGVDSDPLTSLFGLKEPLLSPQVRGIEQAFNQGIQQGGIALINFFGNLRAPEFSMPSFNTGETISRVPSVATPTKPTPPAAPKPRIGLMQNYPPTPEGFGIEEAQPVRFGSISVEEAAAAFQRKTSPMQILNVPEGFGGGSGGRSGGGFLIPTPPAPAPTPSPLIPPAPTTSTDTGGGYVPPSPTSPTMTPNQGGTGGGGTTVNIPDGNGGTVNIPTEPTVPPYNIPPAPLTGGGGMPAPDGKCRNIFGQEVPCGGQGIFDNPSTGGLLGGGGSLLGLLLLLLLLALSSKKERKKTLKSVAQRRLLRN